MDALVGKVNEHKEGLTLLAFCVRLFLIIYGTYQDEWFEVKYSDVDYAVVTDGARYVMEGKSPYLRSTYRYSPIFAYLLLPNLFLHASFGKCLFATVDFLAAELTKRLVLLLGFDLKTAIFCQMVSLFNPLTIGISTRGSGDSLICVLVLLTTWGLVKIKTTLPCSWRTLVVTAFVYGFSVHWRLFPIIFAPAILLYLQSWKERIGFGLMAGFTFFGLGLVFYGAYGFPFVFETFLYHVSRIDVRHNFSVWFYAQYLFPNGSRLLGLSTFLPQLVVQLVLIHKLARKDISFCFLCQTWAFVAFNKVVTAQYFLWYFALLPIGLLSVNKSAKYIVFHWALPWTLSELLWLAAAYQIEFLGRSGLMFFAVNMYVLHGVIRAFQSKAKPE